MNFSVRCPNYSLLKMKSVSSSCALTPRYVCFTEICVQRELQRTWHLKSGFKYFASNGGSLIMNKEAGSPSPMWRQMRCDMFTRKRSWFISRNYALFSLAIPRKHTRMSRMLIARPRVEPDTSTIQARSNFIPAQYCWTTSMSSKATETVAHW